MLYETNEALRARSMNRLMTVPCIVTEESEKEWRLQMHQEYLKFVQRFQRSC